MKKIETTIIRADLSQIVNEKTGEVKDMTKFLYTVDMENTENSEGPALLECYKIGNYIPKIKGKTMKKCIAEIEERPIKNGSKYIIKKIDNMEL